VVCNLVGEGGVPCWLWQVGTISGMSCDTKLVLGGAGGVLNQSQNGIY